MLEYFISTHGARKGLADTALKTAELRLPDPPAGRRRAGRRSSREDDCGTDRRHRMSAARRGRRDHRAARRPHPGPRRRWRTSSIRSPARCWCAANTEIDEDMVEAIEDAGIERVKIRSVLTCQTRAACAQVLRPRPGRGPSVEHRRGGRHHRRAVDRRARHAAHDADLPHRRHRDPAAEQIDARGAQRGHGRAASAVHAVTNTDGQPDRS